MNEKKIRDLYQQKKYDEKMIVRAIGYVLELEKYINSKLNKNFDSIEVKDIRKYLDLLMSAV